jgi:hypothetical protein
VVRYEFSPLFSRPFGFANVAMAMVPIATVVLPFSADTTPFESIETSL